MKRLIDKTLGRYLVVNILCWCIGTSIMFLLFNLHIGGYWFASASNYIIGGTLGYFLNRKYTFRSTDRQWADVLKYIVHMLVCYFLSYSLAPNLCSRLYQLFDLHAANNVSLLVGAGLFAVLNYFGQRYVVFRPKKRDRDTAGAGPDKI